MALACRHSWECSLRECLKPCSVEMRLYVYTFCAEYNLLIWDISQYKCIILSAYKLPLEALCMNRTTIFIAMSTNHEFLLVAKMMMHYDDGHDVVQTECLLCTPLQKLNTLVNQSIQLSLQVQAAFCLVLCHNLSLTTCTFVSCVANASDIINTSMGSWWSIKVWRVYPWLYEGHHWVK